MMQYLQDQLCSFSYAELSLGVLNQIPLNFLPRCLCALDMKTAVDGMHLVYSRLHFCINAVGCQPPAWEIRREAVI